MLGYLLDNQDWLVGSNHAVHFTADQQPVSFVYYILPFTPGQIEPQLLLQICKYCHMLQNLLQEINKLNNRIWCTIPDSKYHDLVHYPRLQISQSGALSQTPNISIWCTIPHSKYLDLVHNPRLEISRSGALSQTPNITIWFTTPDSKYLDLVHNPRLEISRSGALFQTFKYHDLVHYRRLQISQSRSDALSQIRTHLI